MQNCPDNEPIKYLKYSYIDYTANVGVFMIIICLYDDNYISIMIKVIMNTQAMLRPYKYTIYHDFTPSLPI